MSNTPTLLQLSLCLALAACGHSEPFAGTPGRAEEPLTADGLLAISPYEAVGWAGDNSGILIFTPRPTEKYDLPLLHSGARRDPLDNCLGLIPPTGGSMTWQLCDRRMGHFRDSNDVFVTASIGTQGELLYIESSQPPGFFFPVAATADLWLGSRHAPFGDRRHLLTLYRDDFGHRTVSPDEVNWITDVQWAGTGTFIARAYNLDPSSALVPFGIARGVITRDTTTLTIFPNTDTIRTFVPAEGGTTVVYIRSGREIVALPAAGGPERIVATLPAAAGRTIRSISCQQSRCLVLTAEGGGAALWRVSLDTGETISLRNFPSDNAPVRASLSPDGARVVAQRASGRLYLISDLQF